MNNLKKISLVTIAVTGLLVVLSIFNGSDDEMMPGEGEKKTQTSIDPVNVRPETTMSSQPLKTEDVSISETRPTTEEGKASISNKSNKQRIAALQAQIDSEKLIERANQNDLSEEEADRLESLMTQIEKLYLIEIEKEISLVEASFKNND
ncbi:MAG: hypothetical protein HRU19_02710 [Pseudobacteriovorax sp.]|nr:hypothetical protein [Pseudobacteriovorax sp.]